MVTFLQALHLFSAVLLILVILLQSGRDGGMSMTSLGGGSHTIFGSSGGATFFTKLTGWTAAVFLGTAILLSAASQKTQKSVFSGQATQSSSPASTAPAASAAPAAPAAPAAQAPQSSPATQPTTSQPPAHK